MLLAGAVAAASISPASAATNTLDVTVKCRGDRNPTGVPLTMINWDGLQALKSICMSKGGKGSFGATVMIDVDPRTSAANGFERRTGTFTTPVVTTTSTETYIPTTTRYPSSFTWPASFVEQNIIGVEPNPLVHQFSSVNTNTGQFIYVGSAQLQPIYGGFSFDITNHATVGDLNNYCKLAWADCSYEATSSTGGETVQTSTSYVLVCPPSYNYTIVVEDVALGGETAGGGACHWKVI